MFGSNGHEKADYSRGVLERFTRRASNEVNPNTFCKFIANPRTISFIDSPHCAFHFEGIVAINEQKKVKPHPPWHIIPPLTDKIVINHYHCKSWEEYSLKNQRGDADKVESGKYNRKLFEGHDCNDEFDDGILKYRAERAKVYQPPDNSHADERLFDALAINLSPTLLPTTPPEFYAGKMETFLTCRAVASYLQTKLINDAPAKLFEEAALVAILRTLASGGFTFADARLLLTELPVLLTLPYPVVNALREACIQIIPQLEEPFHLTNCWMEIVELEYIQRLLKTWK